MSRYPRQSRNASIKCIDCNAPVVETTDETFVCVDCGESPIERRTPRTIRCERDGIEVTKRLLDEAEPPCIEYSLVSSLDHPVVVHVRDSVPRPDNGDATVDTVDVRWHVPPGGHVDIADRQPALDNTALFDREPEIVVEPTGDITDETGPVLLGDGMAESTEPPSAAPAADTGPPSSRAQEPHARNTSDESAGVSMAPLAGIPAYNEAGTIAETVRETAEYAETVLVVDDGSDDETATRAREAGAVVVEHRRNKGYGAALQSIFQAAHRRGVDALVVLDGDGQHDPSDIPRMCDTQRASGAEIVIASRFKGDNETRLPLYRRFGLSVVNGLTNLSMGVVRSASRITDTQSGFRLYARTAIASLATDDGIGNRMGASLDILYHAHRHDYALAEVGTTIDYDVENASHHSPLAHGYQLVRNILRTVERERPILSLGFPGFVITASGLGAAYLSLSRYLQTGIFSPDYALLSVFAVLVGMLACFTAIILHTLNGFSATPG